MKKTLIVILLWSLAFSVFANSRCCNCDDPLENFNRHTYRMNQKLDFWILQPIARFYCAVTPSFGQKAVHNFFNNLREIPAFCNDVLQLDTYHSFADGWRFAINSTLGIGGLIDIADKMGLPQHNNDFGMTLVRYGYCNSSYFVIPFYGPSTIRDTMALIPYGFETVYFYIQPPGLAWGLFLGDMLDMRVQFLKSQPVLNCAAVDQYAFQRNAYLQFRKNQLRQEFCPCQCMTPQKSSIDQAVDEALNDEKNERHR